MNVRCILCHTGLKYTLLELRTHLREYHYRHPALENVPEIHDDSDNPPGLFTALAPFCTPDTHAVTDEREIQPGGGTFGGAGASGGWDSPPVLDSPSPTSDSSSSDSYGPE